MNKINIIIIEDEAAAAKRLNKMITELMPQAEIINHLDSIVSSVEWFKNNPMPSLVFADIHLADGSSFEIFKQVNVDCPIIFTTAYDQYALEAFKLNSIHYLLKPVKKEELNEALQRFNKFFGVKQGSAADFAKVISALSKPGTSFKERFIIRFGEHIKTIETRDIAYFYTENKANFAVMKDAKRYSIDNNLDELEHLIDPKNMHYIA